VKLIDRLLARLLAAGPLMMTRVGCVCAPHAFLEILERNVELDDCHGARRLAIIFLCADGIASYVVRFVIDAARHQSLPCSLQKFLVISTKQTKPWAGFTLISGVQPDKERC
jgi:hypothetical protein